jgi:pimeloyl-ACP methyl ester carboxylesterase
MKVIAAAILLMASPAFGQPVTGTTPSGIFYEVTGAGEPVVFVHAFSVDRRMWARQVASFESRFKIVRYDLRGHGRSAAPSGPYAGYEDLREVLDTLSIPQATLVGLSAGSEVATNFALAYPGRVTRLILASPGLGGYRLPPLPWAAATFEAAGAGDAAGAAKLWAETPIMMLRSNVAERDTVRSLITDNWRLWTYRRTEQPLQPPAVNRLSEIKAPTLVIVGEQDFPYIKDIASVIARGVNNGRLVTITGAGHMTNLDDPGAFNAALSAFFAPIP